MVEDPFKAISLLSSDDESKVPASTQLSGGIKRFTMKKHTFSRNELESSLESISLAQFKSIKRIKSRADASKSSVQEADLYTVDEDSDADVVEMLSIGEEELPNEGGGDDEPEWEGFKGSLKNEDPKGKYKA